MSATVSAPMLGRTTPVGPGSRRDPIYKCPPGRGRRVQIRKARRAERAAIRNERTTR